MKTRGQIIKMLLLAAVVVAMTATAANPIQSDEEVKPMGYLKLDSAYIDMGRIPRDSIGEATMRFRNTGDAPFTILRIYSECGCTVPSYSSDPVVPGDSGEIRIRFNAKKRNPGTFRKALRIRTNAENTRETLIVKGRVD